MTTKDQARRAAAARRAGLTAAARAEGDARRTACLLPLLEGLTWAAHVSFADEPDTAALLVAGVLLPVLLPEGDLDWAAHDGHLVAGPRGLREPAGPRLGRDALAAVDVVLVPALAVDRRGTRLGRGGGAYDRALPRATGRVLALLHDGELVDALPREAHDAPVSGCALPTGVVDL